MTKKKKKTGLSFVMVHQAEKDLRASFSITSTLNGLHFDSSRPFSSLPSQKFEVRKVVECWKILLYICCLFSRRMILARIDSFTLWVKSLSWTHQRAPRLETVVCSCHRRRHATESPKRYKRQCRKWNWWLTKR